MEQKRNVARWLCKNGNRPEILLQFLLSKVIFKSRSTLIRTYVQLNKYETVPYFLQLSQNLTIDCWLISVYLPVFALCAYKIGFFLFAEQFYDHIMQKMVKTQKSTNNLTSSFGLLNGIKYGAVSYSSKSCI